MKATDAEIRKFFSTKKNRTWVREQIRRMGDSDGLLCVGLSGPDDEVLPDGTRIGPMKTISRAVAEEAMLSSEEE